jgi:hypothetical protein
MIQNNHVKASFVATSSIMQGEQVPLLWDILLFEYRITINYVYRPFKWVNEVQNSAQVYVVIVGFSLDNYHDKVIIDGRNYYKYRSISPYMIDAENILVYSRKNPICNIPEIRFGNQPRDGGNLVVTEEQRAVILSKEPDLEKYIKLYVGTDELTKGKVRYCFWLYNIPMEEYRKSKILRDRIEKVKLFRLKSKGKTTNGYARHPEIFAQIAQPTSDYLAIPEVSTSKRRYIPIRFLSKDIIASNKLFVIPDATLYHFGIITSSIHMAWMRAIGGRLGDGYNYSKEIVYNTFPWPNPTDMQRIRIEKAAANVLAVREMHPEVCLNDMYKDEMLFFPELLQAHRYLDREVFLAFGFDMKMTEEKCVAELLRLYQARVKWG